jgi:hypothetical protein
VCSLQVRGTFTALGEIYPSFRLNRGYLAKSSTPRPKDDFIIYGSHVSLTLV